MMNWLRKRMLLAAPWCWWWKDVRPYWPNGTSTGWEGGVPDSPKWKVFVLCPWWSIYRQDFWHAFLDITNGVKREDVPHIDRIGFNQNGQWRPYERFPAPWPESRWNKFVRRLIQEKNHAKNPNAWRG